MPGQYFLVFFTLPAWRNSFQEALPPSVGQSFLLTGSSLPKSDGLASTAIWANCWVGDDDRDLPTSSSHLTSSTCLSASSNFFSSSLMGEGFLAGDRWCTGEGASFPSLPVPSLPLSFGVSTSSLSSPFWELPLFLPFYNINKRYQPMGKQQSLILARFCLAAILNL